MHDKEAHRYPDCPESRCTPWTSGNGYLVPNGWAEDPSMVLDESYDTPTISNAGLVEPAWANDYGAPALDGSPDLGPYGPFEPMSPGNQFSNYPWSPNDQPLPSPLSETPSYALSRGNSPNPPVLSQPGQISESQPVDPPTAPAANPQPTAGLRPTANGKRKAEPSHPRDPSTKRHTKPGSRAQRTAQGHHKRKSQTSSVSSSSATTNGPNGPTANGGGTGAWTLGGVLPANVDPRVAAEQIKREAWLRCRAGTVEMSQRRLLLRNHEHGALDRETQRLQVNLGLMREAAAAAAAAAVEEDGDWGEDQEGMVVVKKEEEAGRGMGGVGLSL
ncbi:hypothetical protein BT67DRAFT_435339 [Trichocladium antarcticum]|uniref:Uncharacterized protein n=1 Tax=Trichocladium antarcticum TaxID=1450529 RepID=A0AAN6ZC39_9PEZI|nr:hypothetical protein BT67DRAFT_435339 [Trichocladium antarcticum]